jgi:hypothetical protein
MILGRSAWAAKGTGTSLTVRFGLDSSRYLRAFLGTITE